MKLFKGKNYNLLFVGTLLFGSQIALANPVFKVLGKNYTIEDTAKKDPAAYYELEQKKYNFVQQQANQTYLEEYWKKQAKANETKEQTEQRYVEEKVKISEKEITETLNKFKDHPQLSQLPKEQQKEQVVGYLKDQAHRKVINELLDQANSKGELQVMMPAPKEPTFKLEVHQNDHIKYGPKSSDIKPMGCVGNDCAITVVEYSEFQCPYCAKVLPDVEKLMTNYQGKIRWVVRDFLLPSHDRAKPAAIAAKCSATQGKYWEMYEILFKNQRALEDKDILKYAKNINLDVKKFEACYKNPPKNITEAIAKNEKSGAEIGVNGTPAFFINGRRIGGAVPYAEFKRIMDEELSTHKKTM